MFSIQLSVNNPVRSESPIFGDIILSNDPQHASEFDILPTAVEDRLSDLIADNPTFLGTDELTFGAIAGTENIVSVTIDGAIYTLGYVPLAIGEFTFNPDTLDVVVRLRSPFSSNSIITYKGSNKLSSPTTSYLLPPTLRSTKLCQEIERFLHRWNIKGDITINHSFGDHSNFSFNFVACKEQLDSISQFLSNGTIITAFSNRWVIDGVATTLLQNSDEMVVTVNLKDWLASRGTPSKSPLDVRHKLKNGSTRVRSLSQFTGNVGYRGSAIAIRVPKSTTNEETTTLRELVENRAITQNGFVFYGRDGVEVRSWGNTPIHVINDLDVRDDITFQASGHGSLEDGVQLHTEYRNIQVNLDFDPDTADKKQGVTTRWVFENCQDLEDLYSPREFHGFYYKQPNPEVLRNPGINYDAGGRTKKATKITELNGTVTNERTYEAGYAFSSAEVYRVEVTPKGNYIIKFDDPSPQTHWKVVRQTNSDYTYDKDGYLKSIKITGTELTRLQQESEKLEAINFEAQAIINSSKVGGIITPDPSFQAQADAYKFDTNLPINDTTTFELEKLANYFDDTVKPSDRCQDDFVEPKFMALKTRNAESYFKKENPKNNEFFTFPPITSGRFLTEVERNTITSTTFPFKFENRTTAQNNEGEYAKNAIALGTTTQNIGKPGIHSRLDKEQDPFPMLKILNNNYDRYKNKTYYLNSPGVTSGIRTNEGSKSYPDVDDPNEVKAIAETELSIVNTQNSLTTTIDIFWRGGMEVGDRVVFQGKMWVIFGIQDSRTIELNSFNSSSFQLSLGRLLKPKLQIEDRSEC